MRRPYLIVIIVLAVATVLFFIVEDVRGHRSLSASTTPVLVSSGAADGAIPAIDKPSFDSVATADTYLSDDGCGIDVTVNGMHRFYPYQILVWHEVVNETFEKIPLLVTYSPLAGVGAVYSRTVGNTTFDFQASDKLLDNAVVLEDRATKSHWQQVTGEAIDGSATGSALNPYPSTVMTWADWKAAYPKGQVLGRHTGVIRDYTENPYGDYDVNETIYFPLSHFDSRLPSKTRVWGTIVNGKATAYPADKITVQQVQAIVGNDVIVQSFFWFSWAATYPNTDVWQPASTS